MEAPKIYSYDEITGELKGNRFAQLDPLSSQIAGKPVYFQPGSNSNETMDEPLSTKVGYAVCYIDGAWQYLEDHRGTVVYNKTSARLSHIVADLGPIPTEDTAIAPDREYPKWDGEKWVFDKEKWLDSYVRPLRQALIDEADLKYCNAEKWEGMNETERAAWSTYKQALRDLPATIDPDNPVWPEKPKK